MHRAVRLLLLSSFLISLAADLSAQALGRKPVWVLGVQRRLEVSPDDNRQLAVDGTSPNLVDGRGLYLPSSVAVDTSVTPSILYVADSGNNRVLAFRNAASFSNGAAADLVIGQRDRFSSLPQGPTTGVTTGLTFPGAVAVDRNGNLYVGDSGNNRILRFPRPFDQPADSLFPDMVIGQTAFDRNAPNEGGISERSLSLASGNTTFPVSLAFDQEGNLFVADGGNNRVLRYAASALAEGRNGPRANLVLGQTSFTTNTASANRFIKEGLRNPTAVAVDANGRLYVADSLARVLFYETPALRVNGGAASRILGVAPAQVQGQPPPPLISEYGVRGVGGLVVINNRVLVFDTADHRALYYTVPEGWPAETQIILSPPAPFVLGQGNFNDSSPDRGGGEPSASGFNAPIGGAFANGELYVVDSNNNRVMAFPQGGGAFSNATRVLGQTGFQFGAPNLIEGKEFFTPSGVAIDTSVDPPRMYVADTGNNRVLGFRDYRRARVGARADIVVGQVTLDRALANSPTNNVDTPTDTGLLSPTAVVVDSAGNLYVADSGNARVLRFPRPFDQPAGQSRADLVIGQTNFTTKVIDATSRTMRLPRGLAFSFDGGDVTNNSGGLLVADASHSRVLYFAKPFSSGMAASKVIGQADFFGSSSGGGLERLNGPSAVGVDPSDRVYVADTNNSRILIFGRVTELQNQPTALTALTNVQALGLAVSRQTGEAWVCQTNSNNVLRYPRFEDLSRNNNAFDSSLGAPRPLGVAIDASQNIVVTDGAHRVAYFVPRLSIKNAASFIGGALAPGTFATLEPSSNGNCGVVPCVLRNFGTETAVFDTLPDPIPLPRTLADFQVTLDGQPAPLLFVSPRQINVALPMTLPTSGTTQVILQRTNGEIFGALDLGLRRSSPALFTRLPSTTVAAINQDGTIHSPTNPAAPGTIVALYGTGQGVVPNAPPTGTLTPLELFPTEEPKPQVTIGGISVPPSGVTYSGLAPGLLGVWQINVQIPENAPTGNSVQVVILYKDVNNLDPSRPTFATATIAIRR